MTFVSADIYRTDIEELKSKLLGPLLKCKLQPTNPPLLEYLCCQNLLSLSISGAFLTVQ